MTAFEETVHAPVRDHGGPGGADRRAERGGKPTDALPPLQQARRAVERGLAFVEQDAVKWREDRKCSTCHHGAMTVWVLSEAKSQGYPVRAETLAEQAKWATERLKDIEAETGRLLGKQNGDGGWGQDDALPSDAFATGQALYFLSLAGVGRDREEVRRGVSFLVGSQKEDGSWPMTSRAHPGEEVFTNPVPIT